MCRQLRDDGFDPWLDEEALLPGQDWQAEIPQAIHASDAVIVCLSRNSVNHEGYLQKELREVLAVAEEKPPDRIFIIPVRLEDVELPTRLAQWQWADLFRPDGYARVKAALQARASQISLSGTIASDPQAMLPSPTDRSSDSTLSLPVPRPWFRRRGLAGGILAAAICMVPAIWWTQFRQRPQAPASDANGRGPQGQPSRAPLAPDKTRTNPHDGLDYVWVPPGTFTMGCSPGDTACSANEKPAHAVTIGAGFWIGQTEVTVAAYKRHRGTPMPAEPGFNQGWSNEALPIVNVTWDDAAAFCDWTGGRLPTEAEWEYAARGAMQPASAGSLEETAWYSRNSFGRAHEVGRKQANGLGLYDTLGNVFEWVNDWYSETYYSASPQQDPKGPAQGSNGHVLRGDSWYFPFPPAVPRVSSRHFSWPDFGPGTGFRCVWDGKGQGSQR